MNFEERESGLVVPVQPPAPEPEHPARAVIRQALRKLAGELGQFDQTTHGRLGSPTIDAVAADLIVCYQDPRAYTISNLVQAIRALCQEDESRDS